MPSGNACTVDDITTTNTVDVWRNKLMREKRATNEWNYRWGATFGDGKPEPVYDPRPVLGSPNLPPPGRTAQYVMATPSALKYDPALKKGNGGALPAPPSIVTSRASGRTLPSLKATSISSSAARRRELLVQRQHELQDQLALVDDMLDQAKPSTMMTNFTNFSAVSAAESARSAHSSVRSAAAASGRSVPASVHSAAASHASGRSAARSTHSSRRSLPSVTGGVSALPAVVEAASETGSERGSYGGGLGVPTRSGMRLIDEQSARLLSRASETRPSRVPLMLDPTTDEYHYTSPFFSNAGVGFALPGTLMSSLIPSHNT